jgi:mannosylglycerate hydrolase
MSQKTLHLVFQTHWDREWYFTFETYRMRLIHVIKRVLDALDHEEIDRFVLDGQTLPLEDFLEVAELEDQQRIKKWIFEGKIIIGPWFIAMDEFLVHGESIIRNLEIGKETALQYGNNQTYGYLPDTFGHLGQMPQILKNFGIEDAMMWRGISLNQSECIWEGIDGSRLFTIYLSEGYYQPLLNQDHYVKDIRHYIDTIAPRATTNHLLLTAGGDHLMPIRDSIKQRIEHLSMSHPDMNFKINDYQSYTKLVKESINFQDLPIIKGELNSNQRSYILPNVWSTRSYLKINNQQLEDLMIGQIEPMMASIYLKSPHYPQNYVKHIWKTILSNQPHDSICGCSVDGVHRENEIRSEKAFQMIDALKKTVLHDGLMRSLDFYQNKIDRIDADDSVFSIFNPYPYPYTGYVKGDLYLHQQHAMDGFDVMTDAQERFVADIESISTDRMFESPLDYPPFFRHGKTYRIHVEVKDLKPLSFTQLNVIPKLPTKHLESTNTIENAYVKVTLELDGSLTLVDQKTSEIYRGMHQFYSSLDAGDSYNYSRPTHDLLSKATLMSISKIESQGMFSRMSYQLELIQPEGLSKDRQSPSTHTVKTIIDVNILLNQNDPKCNIHLKIDQKAKDQRLRVAFPMKSIIDHSYADSAYELKENQCNREEQYVAAKQKEVPVAVDHSLSMIRLDDSKSSLLVIHRGLHEYQTVIDRDHTQLEVTLVRSVSHLSRDDFDSRGGAAGPNLATPDAQSIRTLDIDYAFGFYQKDTKIIDSYLEAQHFRRPPFIVKGFSSNPISSLFEITNRRVVMTSFRLLKENTVEVRLWNPENKQQSTVIHTSQTIQSIQETRMDHQVIHTVGNHIDLKPNEIKTLILNY